MNPPSTPRDLPEEWAKVEQEQEAVFDIKVVSVTADTVVYRDEALASQHNNETLRFFFATRLSLEPAVGHSGPLRQLIQDRADVGFRQELRERGFTDINRLGTTDIEHESGNRATRVARYDSTVELGDSQVSAVGLAGVWEGEDGEFGFAGGAYPTAIDRETPDWLDSDSMEDELLNLIAQTTL